MSYSYIPENLKRLVDARADGRCEYCLIPEFVLTQGLEFDHIISEKQGGDTTEENLAMACVFCNRFKGSSIASYTGAPKRVVRLFNPREDLWEDHFEFSPSGVISARTEIATGTIFILKINGVHLIKQRRELIRTGIIKM